MSLPDTVTQAPPAEELPDPQRTFAEIVGPARLMEALQEMVDEEASPSTLRNQGDDVD